MVTLRKLTNNDVQMLSERFHMSTDQAKQLVAQSDAEVFHDRFFQMFIISVDGLNVGALSIFEHSPSIVSIGPEVFEEYRQHGYATAAMKIAMNLARSKGYSFVSQQIRTNNAASIKLHLNLGFESDRQVHKSRNQNEVFIYVKAL